MSFLANKLEVFPRIYVGAQLKKLDLLLLKEAGIKTIICNRPDNEDVLQTNFSDIENEALKYNIKAIFLPFTMPTLEKTHVFSMKKLLENSEKPIYAYCGSGGRVVKLCSIISNLESFDDTTFSEF